tara:strand:- start:13308 stop:13748 length:441 start_codon:yes stop_codon:yes gene_type:complete
MAYHQMIMSYLNKIQFWTEQLADAKGNLRARYSVVRCEESLAYFTAKEETLLSAYYEEREQERRVDAVAESLTESRTRLTSALQNGDFFFTEAHYHVMADAISLIEEKIVKDYLSYSHNDAMTDTISQALFEATWEAVRKVIKNNA